MNSSFWKSFRSRVWNPLHRGKKVILHYIPFLHSLLIWLFLVFTFFSCYESTHRGYKRFQPNVFYRLNSFGEDTVRLNDGDLIMIDISYSTLDDSVFYRGIKKIRLEDPGFTNSVYRCFKILNKGDSASFIFRTSDFFKKNLNTVPPSFMNDHRRLKINVSVLEIQTKNDFQQEKIRFLRWAESINRTEKETIMNFLEEEGLKVNPASDGLYFILMKAGEGFKPVPGDLVKIHYEGRFMNGHYFDNSRDRGEPLEFILGQDFMVIKGIEEALKMMREGDVSLIILPSGLAFGSEGTGDGLIPPFTALIYELELIKVQKFE